MEAMRAMMSGAFQEKLVVFLKGRHEVAFEEIGEEETRRRVESGLAKAKKHGFVVGDEPARYVELVFLFGVGFDEVAGWPREILAEAVDAGPSATLARLYLTAMDQLDLDG